MVGRQAKGCAVSIEVSHLQKRFGSVTAVKDLSFTVDTGSLFAFLGSNGAGKSTTIGCITTTMAPTSGSIRVNGHDVRTEAQAVRGMIGAVFQSSLLDPLLTVRENLTVRAGFYGLSLAETNLRIDELAQQIGLGSYLDRRYGKLSGGQKRRADIARALIHGPSVVFLDEPTAGLDPASRQHIWTAIEELRASRGATIFLTTHYMEETERADDVCIIDHGEIVAEGSPASLRAEYSSSILTVRSSNVPEILDECRRRGLDPAVEGREILIPVVSAGAARDLLNALPLDDFEFRHGTMDDVFLAVTGGGVS